MMDSVLYCPVCREDLAENNGSLVCGRGHSFDIAKENYVNLISGAHKSGDVSGDNKSMARSRKSFLDKGYYACLAEAVGDLLEELCPKDGNVLDICCGEGYYSAFLAEKYPSRRYYGFDLSKEMVRLAAKRKCGERFFAANIASIPVKDDSIDFAFHLFAPFHAQEFYRIIRPGGTLVTAVPGKRHLFAMKEILYDEPYENDGKAPETGSFTLYRTVNAGQTITLDSREDINALFQMTPYYYHTPAQGMKRLEQTDMLTTETDFVLYVLKKTK